MAEIVNFEKTLWLTSVLLQSALFALLLYRKNYKPFPFFSAYVLVTLLQNAALFVSYRLWGFKSPVSFGVAWATQGLVVVARVLAVTEIFRHVLAKYRGVWALVWRILLAAAGCVLAYSWVVARHTLQLRVRTPGPRSPQTIAKCAGQPPRSTPTRNRRLQEVSATRAPRPRDILPGHAGKSLLPLARAPRPPNLELPTQLRTKQAT